LAFKGSFLSFQFIKLLDLFLNEIRIQFALFELGLNLF